LSGRRAREPFDRGSDDRAGLRSFGRYGDHSTQSSLALDPREQLRVVSFKSLETICDFADSCF
jgi:hypothetical protein